MCQQISFNFPLEAKTIKEKHTSMICSNRKKTKTENGFSTFFPHFLSVSVTFFFDFYTKCVGKHNNEIPFLCWISFVHSVELIDDDCFALAILSLKVKTFQSIWYVSLSAIINLILFVAFYFIFLQNSCSCMSNIENVSIV